MKEDDPLLERLCALRRDELDDMTAARTLARAEAAIDVTDRGAGSRRRRWAIPAVLGVWAMLYLWGAVAEISPVSRAQRSVIDCPRSRCASPIVATKNASGCRRAGARRRAELVRGACA